MSSDHVPMMTKCEDYLSSEFVTTPELMTSAPPPDTSLWRGGVCPAPHTSRLGTLSPAPGTKCRRLRGSSVPLRTPRRCLACQRIVLCNYNNYVFFRFGRISSKTLSPSCPPVECRRCLGLAVVRGREAADAPRGSCGVPGSWRQCGPGQAI